MAEFIKEHPYFTGLVVITLIGLISSLWWDEPYDDFHDRYL